MATAIVATVAITAALAGLGTRATYGARVTADEPQYLLTAISLGEDAGLDISDELADERFRSFHEADLNPQTIDLDQQGRRVSPHDPLLPLLLALPFRLGGWVGARLALVLCAGAVAALTLRLAVSRLQAPLGPATAIVAGFAAAPPFSTYGTQIYPAMPAALGVVVGALAITDRAGPAPGPSPDHTDHAWFRDPSTMLAAVAVISLPWLSVKYVPVAAVIAMAGLWRLHHRGRRQTVPVVAAYVAAAAAYLALHQRWYGGWTVYAAGDHFVDGEWLVIGSEPDYAGRTRRLAGLLVDRSFGLAAWNPAFLLVPPALLWLARSRRPGRLVLPILFATGWSVATWIAFTMHGWWWPGRQVVPVLPIGVAAVAALVGSHRRRLAMVMAATVVGTASWLWLAWETSTGRRALIVDFEQTTNPWYRLWRLALPDHRRMATIDVILTAGWIVALVVATIAAGRWRPVAPTRPAPDPSVDDDVGGEPLQ